MASCNRARSLYSSKPPPSARGPLNPLAAATIHMHSVITFSSDNMIIQISLEFQKAAFITRPKLRAHMNRDVYCNVIQRDAAKTSDIVYYMFNRTKSWLHATL